jgi:energy-converting hydrogenase Eha subunit B
MIGSMSVTATTDAGHIAVLLDQRLAADPVRATVLGSIALTVACLATGTPHLAPKPPRPR